MAAPVPYPMDAPENHLTDGVVVLLLALPVSRKTVHS